MLIRGFFWRMLSKYIYLDFHPLVFFFFFGMILFPYGVGYGLFLVYKEWADIGVTGPQSMVSALCIITGLQFLLFGMWFDMEASK